MSGTIAAVLKYAHILAAGNFGYSKKTRWSGFKNGQLVQPGNFDCSSSTGAILKLAGFPIDLSDPFYSANIQQRAIAGGYVKGPNPKGKSLAWLVEHVTAGAVLSGPGHVVVGMGDGKILSFESSEHHTDDGKLGRQPGEIVGVRDLYVRSKTWTGLALPKPETVAQATPLAFRAAQASQEAEHFGGPRNYLQRGVEMSQLGASLIGATETTVTAKGETAWSGRVAMQKGLGKGWTRVAFLAVALFWDSSKYSKAGARRTVAFGAKGDIWHGALLQPLMRKDAKARIDVGEIHVRSRGAFPAKATDAEVKHGKGADVARLLAMTDKSIPTIILGDTAGDFDYVFTSYGFTRVSPKVDTYDASGKQTDDGIWVSHHLLGSDGKAFNPGIWSDHKWLSVHVTAAPTTV